MTTKKKAPKKPPREDFNEAAFRIVQQAVREKSDGITLQRRGRSITRKSKA